MKELLEIYKQGNELHHAYAIFGNQTKIFVELKVFIENCLNVSIQNNPDLLIQEFNVLKIDDARNLINRHLNKPINRGRKIFIVIANFITRDAQNSLLKVLEEPQAQTTFFFILPKSIFLLGTLKSRLICLYPKIKADEINQKAEKFIKGNIRQRLNICADFISDLKDEKITKGEIINFIKEVETYLYVQKDKVKPEVFESLETAISYANDESPSMKVILEHLAITI